MTDGRYAQRFAFLVYIYVGLHILLKEYTWSRKFYKFPFQDPYKVYLA